MSFKNVRALLNLMHRKQNYLFFLNDWPYERYCVLFFFFFVGGGGWGGVTRSSWNYYDDKFLNILSKLAWQTKPIKTQTLHVVWNIVLVNAQNFTELLGLYAFFVSILFLILYYWDSGIPPLYLELWAWPPPQSENHSCPPAVASWAPLSACNPSESGSLPHAESHNENHRCKKFED